MSSYLFTSESVSEGHPDKIADQISDAVLDAILAQDKRARVACETMVKTGAAIVAGEVTTSAWVDIENLTLPEPIERAKQEGKTINALYQLEVLASPRGKPWYLTRRIAEP